MLFSSPVYSQVSGSIAGITYGHGRSGMFSRSRSTPTNPNSEHQRHVRHALAALMPYWGQQLSATERSTWRMYASNVPWKNALGQTIFLTGHQHFCRTNVPRIQAGIDILDAAPTIYDLGSWTPPLFMSANTVPQAIIQFELTDAWCSQAGGYGLCYAGKSVGPGHKFFRGPWRYAGKLDGSDPPPFGFFAFDTSWPWSLNNLCWIIMRLIQPDGRMSMPIILGPDIIEAP